MASKPSTIRNVKKARNLDNSGHSKTQIAKNMSLSVARIEEYLERNSHPLSCRICGGYGVNKQRSTGKKTPICA